VKQISAAEARQYFWHPAQLVGDGSVADMRDDGFVYFEQDGVCGAFHDVPWPRIIAAHVGALRSAWGRALAPALAILRYVWGLYQPARIVIWVQQKNRAAVAFAKRLGFVADGLVPLPEPVVMMGWTCR
jgi:hypothetical protein